MSQSPKWGHTAKQLVAATLILLTGLLIYRFRSLLPPIIIAALLSYTLAPIVGWLSRVLHIRRGLATLLLYLIGLAALTTVPAIAVPTIVNEVQSLQLNLNDIINRVIAWIDQFNGKAFNLAGFVLTFPQFDIPTFSFQNVVGLLRDTVSPLAGGAFNIVISVASGVGWVLFVAVVCFYMLMDAERIGPAFLSVVPSLYRDEAARLGGQINRTWNAFLRGQLVLCFTIGVTTWLAMAAVGIPYSLGLGVIAGVLEIIPSVGPILSSVPAILLALFQGSSYIGLSNFWVAVLVAGVYILIQNLESNLLVPRIIGSTLNLHPLVVIIGVLAGATLASILGVLLAAPIMATMRDIIRYVYCKLADQDPFPPPPSLATRMKKQDICAFLFDLDGTLLDSDDMAVDRWARRLRPFSFLDRLYDSRKAARGLIMALETPINAAITLLDMIGLDGLVLSWSEGLRQAYAQCSADRYASIPGAVELVKSLAPHYRLGLVTTRNREDADQFLACFDLQEAFQVVVTRQDVKRLKPHPEPIRYAAQRLGCSTGQCVVVGDTTVDVQAGQRAGALTVAVLCGFGERAELERLGPDLILETTAQLAEQVEEGRA